MTKVTLIGDSITSGLGTLSDWLGTVASTWVNAGTGGNLSYDVLARVASDVSSDTTHCVILIGINDIVLGAGGGGSASDLVLPGTSSNRYTSVGGYIAQIVADLRTRSILPVLGTVMPTMSTYANAAAIRTSTLTLNAWLRLYATGAGVSLVEFYTAFVSGSYGNPIYYGADGLHPNTSGKSLQMSLIAETILGDPQYALRAIYRDTPTSSGDTLVAYETVDTTTPRTVNWMLRTGSAGYTGTGMTDTQIDSVARTQAGL